MGTSRRSLTIIMLTGERGVGKSTVCQRAAALAKSRHYRCGGIITLHTSQDARDALDARSGQARPLTRDSGHEGAVRIGHFRFDPATFAWGNDVLASALPCDLLVVDELGPLEFERGQGWMAAFDVVRKDGFSLAVVVVRPELVERARSLFRDEATTVLHVTAENRDALPQTIVEMLQQQSQGAYV